MIGRCKYPTHTSWKWYGARGITVAPRWLDFENFLADMGEPPFKNATIERREKNGPYSKENCYWATPSRQARNTSKSVMLTFNGVTQSLPDWSDQIGIRYETLSNRIYRGWTPERALTQPVKKQ